MGQIADDMVDGTVCCLCSMFFQGKSDPKQVTKDNPRGETIYTHGYPAVCWDCWRDLSKRDRKQYQRALVPTI